MRVSPQRLCPMSTASNARRLMIHARRHLRTLVAMAIAAQPAAGEGIRPLGRLEPFWRHTATLGPYLETGHAMIEIPAGLGGSDFPYRRRPFAKEAPFADHLSVVRLLGGYASHGEPQADRDLAFRRADGGIGYRWHLLEPRLRPALELGYDLTLVLDNIPWCFPETPRLGGFGQCVPPKDPAEWSDFVTALCQELVAVMGPDRAGRLRFRVGTENNGLDRFDASAERYFRHYDDTAAAIRAVIPTAKVGPFNISGASVRGIDTLHNVGGFALAEHCLGTGAASLVPVDWIAFSRYYAPGTDPSASAGGCRTIWDEFERRVPRLAGVSREIHEFGIAPFGEAAKGVFVSAEPGALGAALTCQMMLRLREAGVDRLWHWNVHDTLRDRGGRPLHLFDGDAWVMSVLEHQVGSDAHLLPVPDSSAGTLMVAALFVTPQRAVILASGYHPDSTQHPTDSLVLSIPKDLWAADVAAARIVRLHRRNSVWDRIRRDLASNGLLRPEFIARPDRLGTLRQMGTGRAAELLVADHYDDYARAWNESLTLVPFETPDGIQWTPDGLVVAVSLTAPETVAIVLDAQQDNAPLATGSAAGGRHPTPPTVRRP